MRTIAPGKKLSCWRRVPGQHMLALEGMHRRIAHEAQLQPGAHQDPLPACLPLVYQYQKLQ